METVQIQFDELVQKFGAEEVIKAIKNHVKPDSGTGCTKDSDCGNGYYCDNGQCRLNVGP